MPIYKVNDKTYNIPDNMVDKFERDFPEAMVDVYDGNDSYSIPVSSKSDFLKDFPTATFARTEPRNSGTGGGHGSSFEAEQPQTVEVEDGDGFEQNPKVRERILDNIPDYFKSKGNNLSTRPLQSPEALSEGDISQDMQQRVRMAERAANDPYIRQQELEHVFKPKNQEQINVVKGLIDTARQQRIAERSQRVKSAGDGGLFGTMSQAYLAGEQNDADKQLEYASTLVEEAQNITDEAKKKGNTNFVSGFARGFKDAPLDGWAMGLQDLKNYSAAKKVMDKVDRGKELNPAEDALMQALVTNAATKMYYAGDLGLGYKAGGVTAGSLPSIFDMISGMGAIQAVTKPASKALVKYATEKAAQYGLGKVSTGLAKGAARMVSGLRDVAAHTATFGSARVAADYQRRGLGDIQVAPNADGTVSYDGRENIQTGAEAIGKAIVSTAAETGSELVGEYFGPMLGWIGKATGANKLSKIIPSSVGKMYSSVVGSQGFKQVQEIAKRAKITDPIGEYSEEVLNNLVSTAIGDMTPEQLVDLDNNIDTFLGVAPMSVLFGAAGTGGYLREKYKNYRNAREFERQMQDVMGEDWSGVREALQDADIETARNMVKDVLSSDMNSAMKKKAINYISAVMQEQTLQEVDKQMMPEDIANNKRAIINNLKDTRSGINLSDDELNNAVYAIKNGQDISSMYDTDTVNSIMRYEQAYNDYLDYTYWVRNRAYDARKEAESQVESLTNATTGTVMRVKAGFSDNPVNVLRGNIVFDGEGNVDVNQSDNTIYYLADDGKVKMAPISSFESLIDNTPAEEMIKQAGNDAEREVIQEEEAQIASPLQEIENETRFVKDGNTYEVVNKTADGYIVAALGEDGNILGTQPIGEEELRSILSQNKAGNAVSFSGGESSMQNTSADNMSTQPTDGQSQQEVQSATQVQMQETPTALSRIPMNEQGEQDFESASSSDTSAALLEISDSVDDAKDTAQQMIEHYSNELKKAEKAKTAGNSIQEIVRLKQEKKSSIQAINQKIAYWKEVASAIESRRPGGIIEQAKAESDKNQQRLASMTPEEQATVQAKVQENINRGAYEKAKPRTRSRYVNEDKALGDSATPMEHVLREIATGRVAFRWTDNGSTKGLGAHLGTLDSNEERRKHLWALSNEGYTPEAAAEIIYADMPESLQSLTDDTDVLNMILAAFQEYSTPSRMFEAAKGMHGVDEVENAPGYDAYMEQQALEWKAAQNNMSVEEWIVYNEIIEDELEKYASSLTDDEINAIFEQIYEQILIENESRRNEGESAGSAEESSDNTGGDEILPEQGSDNQGADAEGDRQDGEDEADVEGSGMVSEQQEREVDENGYPFSVSPDGNIDFGKIKSETGLTEAPIRLVDGTELYGKSHIERNHGEQIRNAGFSSVEDFVSHVASNYDTIKEGNQYFDKHTYLLELTDKKNNTLFIELSKDGSYWNVNSAGVFRKGYSKNKETIWTAPALGHNSTTKNKGVTSSITGNESSTGSTSGNSPQSVSSVDKDSQFVAEKQDNEVKFIAPGIRQNEGVIDYARRIAKEKEIWDERKNVEPNPTEAQKEAGNYRKGHVKIDGYDITIENPKGSVRSGKDADGNKWSVTLNNDYGYIRGTEGVDGDHIDVFLSDNPAEGDVFVIDQINPDGTFDEHKVMYGFKSALAAKRAYLANYSKGWTGLGTITRVSKGEFKEWIDSSHRKTKPFAQYASVNKDGVYNETVVKENTSENGNNSVSSQSGNSNGHNNEQREMGSLSGESESFNGENEAEAYLRRAGDRTATQNGQGSRTKESLLGELAEKTSGSPQWINDVENIISSPIGKGGENEVYLSVDKKNVIKVNDFSYLPDNSTDFDSFMNRLDAHNELFPNDAITVLGFTLNSDGKISVVLSQPYISNAREATQEEIDSFLEDMDFYTDMSGNWTDGTFDIADTKPNNVLVDEDGNLHFIDVLPYDSRKSGKMLEIPTKKQELDKEYPGNYTIVPAQYTTKRGKILDMYLVTFEKGLDKDTQRKSTSLAKELKGWWDKEKRGFMMRREDDARKLVEAVASTNETVPPVHEDLFQMIDRKAKLKKKSAPVARELRTVKGIRNVYLNENKISVSGSGVWAEIEWGDRKGDGLTAYLSDQYRRFKSNYDYAAQNGKETQEAAYGEMKNLACKLAGMTEDEMRRYIDKQADSNTLYRNDDDLNDVNERFNEKLKNLKENPEQKGRVLSLGMAGDFLRAGGIANAEILLDYDKIVRKSKEGYKHEHPYDIEDIADLPSAINAPIAVFDNTNGKNGGKVILTEMKKDGRNFIVAVQAVTQHRKGGVVLEVNKITTLFPKDERGIVHWFNQGKATNIDKGKALRFIEALLNHSGTTITNEELFSATNIVKNFENPTLGKDFFERDSDDDLNVVNEKFNEELEKLTESNADKIILDLGTPSDILLSAGVSDKPMKLYGNKVIKKMKKHGFALEELYDLPIAVADPIAVFDNYKEDGNRSILTELRTRQGNFLVSVSVGKDADIDFNIVRSVFGKGDGNVVNWINKGMTTYINKEKALSFLSHQSAPIAAAAANEELSSATNIVKNFENPTLEQGKITSAIEEAAERMNIPVTVVRSADELPEDSAARKRIEEGKKVKGWYSLSDRKVYIYLPNASGMEDVKRTFLHEGVAHYGLRRLVGEERFDDFLDDVFTNVSKEVRERIINTLPKFGYNSRTATEEYLASMAENGVDVSVWQRVKQAFKNLMRRIGIGIEISDNELRYILWRSRQNLDMDNPIDMAHDIARQYRMGVGNYYREETSDGSREAYEKSLQGWKYKAREAYQDSMLALKNLQNVIADVSGKPIQSFEDAYKAENQLSSKNTAEAEKYYDNFFIPMLREEGKLMRKYGLTHKAIERYMMLAHGIERNVEMTFREKLNEIMKDNPDDARQFIDDYRNEKERLRSLYSGYEYLKELSNYMGEVGDYSATQAILKDMDGEEHSNFQSDTLDYVRDFENAYDVNELWNKTNRATKETLKKTYESGLMSKEHYGNVKNMFMYYVPLRGWKEKTAEDVYEYIDSDRSPVNSVLKEMKGRLTPPDEIMATIGNMAESAILQGNRNLMKQTFMNMVLNHPTDVATLKRAWYVYDPASDEWNVSMPSIQDNDTPEIIARKIEDHDNRMKALKEQGIATQTSTNLNINYRIMREHISQHAVNVKIGGKDYIIYVNGNPRAAQAVNGLTNPDAEKNPMFNAISTANRWLAANFTTRNPAFVISNLARDLMFSMSAVRIKEDAKYLARFRKNILLAILTVPRNIKGNNGSTEADRYFREFVENGGETGYMHLNDVDKYKKKVRKELAKITGERGSAMAALDYTVEKLEDFNRWAEDISRFAVYMTSRQMGRSVVDSVNDAKEVTVNFNKKGSGYKTGGFFGLTAGMMRNCYLFFNASVQSLSNFKKLKDKQPVKFYSTLGGYMAAGMLMPVINNFLHEMFGNGDDPYNDLPDWVRRNNLCIYAGDGQFVTVPLPIELRAFYGLGDYAYQLAAGREKPTPIGIVKGTVSQIADLLPLNPTGNEGFRSFMPDALAPIFETYVWNEDFTGKPIAKLTPFNERDPEWKRVYKGTSGWLVDTSKFLNDLTNGGEPGKEFRKGFIDFNPAKVENLFESYFGGMAKFLNQAGKTIYYGAKSIKDGERDENLTMRNAPIVNRLVSTVDERNAFSGINTEYFNLRDEMEQFRYELNGVKKNFRQNPEEYKRMTDSDMYDKYMIYRPYQKKLDKLYRIGKETAGDDKKLIEDEIIETRRELLQAVK